MIRQVKFRAFKALAEVDIDLDSFTLLVGANGSGKSSVLEGLHYLLQLAGGTPDATLFSGPRAVTRLRTAGESAQLTLSCQTDNNVELIFSNPGKFRYRSPNSRGYVEGTQAGSTDRQLLRDLGSVVRLRLDPDVIASAGARDGKRVRVEYDGSSLAPSLADLLGRRDPCVEEIERDLRSIVPSVRHLRVVAADVVRQRTELVRVGDDTQPFERTERIPGFATEIEVEGSGWLGADLLSEGTRIALALFTIIHSPERPRMILLDDIDRALHPAAQVALVERLKDFQEKHSDVQIIATSHSPYLLDIVNADAVRVLGLRDGRTVCKRLTDHPDWSKWKDSLRPGEFWGSVGEAWVAS